MLARISRKGEWVVYKIRLKSFKHILDVRNLMDDFFDEYYKKKLHGYFFGIYKIGADKNTLVVGIHSPKLLDVLIKKFLISYEDEIIAVEVHFPDDKPSKEKERFDDYWLCNGFVWNWYSYQVYRTLKRYFGKHGDVREFDRYSYNHLTQMFHRIMNNLNYDYKVETLLYSEMLTHFIRSSQLMDSVNERFIDETKDMRL